MNLINEFEKNVINRRDKLSSKSGDEISAESCRLSCEIDDSSEENSGKNIHEDYFEARNYFGRRNNWLVHKAIVDRAYNFIYDEAFSNESTTESESLNNFAVDNNYSRKNDWALNLVDENEKTDFLSSKKFFIPKCSEKKIGNREGIGISSSGNSAENLEDTKSISNDKILAKKMKNFQDRYSSFYRNSPSSSSCSFYQESRNTSRSESSERCTKSISNSSDFLSETCDFGKSIENHEGKRYFCKKNLKKKKNSDSNLETIHGIRRKRILSTSTYSKNRSNYLQDNFQRRNGVVNYETENSLERISRTSKLRNRLKPISKMRKIYSEQILIAKFQEGDNEASILFEEDNSSSDDSLVIDVEKILQENLRAKNIHFTAETILMENKNGLKKLGRNKNLFSYHNYTSDTQANEVKLLGDIKKRIDDDFECDFNRSKVFANFVEDEEKSLANIDSEESLKIISPSVQSKSFENLFDGKSLTGAKIFHSRKNNKKSFKFDERQNFVDSIDSGVSTDFSRNESDLSRTYNEHCDEKSKISSISEDRISTEDEKYLTAVTSFSNLYSNFDEEGNEEEKEAEDELLEENVEKAVQKFTEELIMCERRAVERGLIDEIRRESSGRKRKKPSQKAQYSSSSSPKSCNTFPSPREFLKTSQSSSEEEYLENISPPSFCSISDSDFDNLLDFYD